MSHHFDYDGKYYALDNSLINTPSASNIDSSVYHSAISESYSHGSYSHESHSHGSYSHESPSFPQYSQHSQESLISQKEPNIHLTEDEYRELIYEIRDMLVRREPQYANEYQKMYSPKFIESTQNPIYHTLYQNVLNRLQSEQQKYQKQQQEQEYWQQNDQNPPGLANCSRFIRFDPTKAPNSLCTPSCIDPETNAHFGSDRPPPSRSTRHLDMLYSVWASGGTFLILFTALSNITLCLTSGFWVYSYSTTLDTDSAMYTMLIGICVVLAIRILWILVRDTTRLVYVATQYPSSSVFDGSGSKNNKNNKSSSIIKYKEEWDQVLEKSTGHSDIINYQLYPYWLRRHNRVVDLLHTEIVRDNIYAYYLLYWSPLVSQLVSRTSNIRIRDLNHITLDDSFYIDARAQLTVPNPLSSEIFGKKSFLTVSEYAGIRRIKTDKKTCLPQPVYVIGSMILWPIIIPLYLLYSVYSQGELETDYPNTLEYNTPPERPYNYASSHVAVWVVGILQLVVACVLVFKPYMILLVMLFPVIRNGILITVRKSFSMCLTIMWEDTRDLFTSIAVLNDLRKNYQIALLVNSDNIDPAGFENMICVADEYDHMMTHRSARNRPFRRWVERFYPKAAQH